MNDLTDRAQPDLSADFGLTSAIIGDWVIMSVTKTWNGLNFRVETADTTIGFNAEPVQGDVIPVAFPYKDDPEPLTPEQKQGILYLEEFEHVMEQVIRAQTKLQKLKRALMEGGF